ncbi:diphosphomevalonate decarboxylase [Salinarchaeum sp. Harcht-Bsk1]|uniref:phosphomevalonate decarboxylase MvaD n=1 Tax=Salinarchaeum sp. Harcht-Bsk1 TaxID=1333523 RepID=UPI0003422BC4|nr:phosphomevalonate decarboxylase MvaD [Salinarchaeum sp. Harcht-Bsk1]AGN02407.1 diphosphomevalonate decarboxylase [Salinarchaeum sp. Harcht-Bsk1]
MKATAIAHPIQGIVKYHGMRDAQQRLPYHDSISVCTAPSHSKTTVEFSMDNEDNTYLIDGEEVEGSARDRLDRIVEEVRERSDAPHAVYGVRMESENSFPTNVGLGSSSSGFAAIATALAEAAELDATLGELSAIARRGSASAARSVTGGYSHLRAGLNDQDCRSHRIDSEIAEDHKIVVGLVPSYKDTDDAHEEAVESHMFQARMAHIHEQIAECRDALRKDDFDRVFELAEHDSLSLAATTMTGPEGWVYWSPKTLQIFAAVRELREEDDIPVYFSTDTGASVYVNTTEEHVDEVEEAVADCGVQTAVWEVGGPARILKEEEQALF